MERNHKLTNDQAAEAAASINTKRRVRYVHHYLAQLRGDPEHNEVLPITRTTSWRTPGLLDCDVVDRKKVKAHQLPQLLTPLSELSYRGFVYFGDLQTSGSGKKFVEKESGFLMKFTWDEWLDKIVEALDWPALLKRARG